MSRAICRLVATPYVLWVVVLGTLSASPCVQGGGLTIITHGYDRGDCGDDHDLRWLLAMRNLIASRGPIGDSPSYWVLGVGRDSDDPTKLKITYEYNDSGSDGFSQPCNGEILVVLDWMDAARCDLNHNEHCDEVATGKVAQVVADYLLNRDMGGHRWVDQPIHLIGHSRGASMMAALARRLGQSGVWVDQVTTLDPHPVNAYQDDDCLVKVDCGTDDFGDSPVDIAANVVFADNYWREDGTIDEFCDPDGELVAHAFDVHLCEDVLSGVNQGYPLEHFDVPLWYHGTVALASDGEKTPPKSWYEKKAYDDDSDCRDNDGYKHLRHGPRPNVGFNWSRVAGGTPWTDPASEGYHGWLLGKDDSNRDGIDWSKAQWPNVLQIDLDAGPNYGVGEKLNVHYYYHDYNNTCTVSFYLDDNQNPYDGATSQLGSRQFSKSQRPQSRLDVVDTDGVEAGDYYVVLHVTDGTHERFAYYQKQIHFSNCADGSGQSLTLDDDDNVWEENGGDNDDCIEVGEEVLLDITMCANEYVGDIHGTLSAEPSSAVELSDDRGVISGIGKGGCSDFNDRFQLKILSDANIRFTLHVEYEVGGDVHCQDFVFYRQFPDVCPPPTFRVCGIDVKVRPDKDCDQNGKINSGDTADLRFKLKNLGEFDAIDVDAAIDPASVPTGIEIDNGNIDYDGYGTIHPGDCVWPENDTSHVKLYARRDFSGSFCADVLFTFRGRDPNDPVVLPDAVCVTIPPKPWINVEPDVQDFGVLRPGSSTTLAGEVRNSGSGPMQVSDLQIIRPDGVDVSISPPLPWDSIRAGSTKAISITISANGFEGDIRGANRIEVSFKSDACFREGSNDEPSDDRTWITGNISDAPPTTVIETAVRPEGLDAGDGVIVWVDYRAGSGDIYGFDLDAGVEFPICTDTHSQYHPRTSGRLVVWEDNRNWNGDETYFNRDVYGFDLEHPELGNFVVSADADWNEELLGVSGDLVAFTRDYEILDRQYRDAAANLIVYRYTGEGQFEQILETGFRPTGGTNPRESVSDPSGRNEDGDFSEGFAVFKRFTWTWSTKYGYWEEKDQHLEVLDIANGDSSPSRAFSTYGDTYAAVAHRFYFAKYDSNRDTQLWRWRKSGIEQLTNDDREVGQDALAAGGPDGDDIVIFENGDGDYPGLYYWERPAGGKVGVLSHNARTGDLLRMNGYLAAWIDYNDGQKLYFAIFKQADVSVVPSNVSFSNDRPIEGETVEVTAVVRNITSIDQPGNITATLYLGDPGDGEALGQQTIAGIEAGGSRTLVFEGIIAPTVTEQNDDNEQLLNLCIKLIVDGDDNPANNEACKLLHVRDDDVQSPSLYGIRAQEYQGNGDGLISESELVEVVWNTGDASGIATTDVTVTGFDPVLGTPLEGETYHAILGPLTIGTYEGLVTSTDGDQTPLTALGSVSIEVQENHSEPDCNHNGIRDDIDIADGTSIDCNSNEVPDECDSEKKLTLLVSDRSRNAVLVYDALTGRLERTFTSELLSYPNGIAIDSNGDFFVASVNTNRILRVSGSTLDVLSEVTSDLLDQPVEPLLLSDSRLLVSSYGNDRILSVDLPGGKVSDWVVGENGGLSRPGGLAINSRSNIVITSSNSHQVLEFDGVSGQFVRIAAQGNGLDGPTDLLIDKDGNLLVTSFQSDSVLRFDTNGKYLGECVPQGAGGLDGPESLVWGPDEVLQVTSLYGGSVLQFGANCGSFEREIGRGEFGVPTFIAIGYLPTDCNGNGVLDSCDVATGNSGDGNKNGIPDECELTIAETNDVTILAEGRNGDSYTVGLVTAPSREIIVKLAYDASQLTPAPTELRFTQDNWSTPQLVTVAAVDDDREEGVHSSAITHTAQSDDKVFDGLLVSLVVQILDNDSYPIGDSNCDGAMDFNDIDAFVTAVTSKAEYERKYPNCHYLNADIDGSDNVDFDDIDPFVECLINNGCP